MPRLDHLAGVHHGDPIAELGDQAEMVRDEQDRAPHLVFQLAQEVDDLRLERDVERRGRLVGDQQVRPRDQRERDADALAHAARELVRVAVDPALGVGDADAAQHGDRAAALLGAAGQACGTGCRSPASRWAAPD